METVCRERQCKTCIFRPRSEVVTPERLAEIQEYLVAGTNHLCHSEDNAVCRGGRDFQLTVWSRIGLIAEPTDQALAAAMRRVGIKPRRAVVG